MQNITSTLAGLAFGAAAAMVVAATVHLPSALIATAHQATVVAPGYPHNINPDPNGPYYLNPYADGEPADVTPPVIGLSPRHSAPESIQAPEQH